MQAIASAFTILTIIFCFVVSVYSFDYGYKKGNKSGWVQYHEGKVECTKVFERTECRLMGEEK